MNQELLIKKLKSFPFVLAPMAGITNAPFRLLMREMGSSVVISELISATGLEYESRKTKELCFFFKEESPFGFQIFGESKEHLALSAKKLEEMGADIIDINCGCPVPKVVKKGAGSALLKSPNQFYEVMKTVRSVLSIPLTVKIRTGWDEKSKNADEIVQAAFEAGCAWVAIHGRTRAQGYEGFSDWEFIAKVKQNSKIPIIGNGDILTASQAIDYHKKFGVDAVMIGRGALRNPFIFQEIAKLLDRSDIFLYDETTEELAYWRLIDRHIELMEKLYKPEMVSLFIRKFAAWYSAGFEGASKFRKLLFEIPIEQESLPQIKKLVYDFFHRPNLKKSHAYLSEAFLQGGHG
jgi:nifR3 family TIM-barrel protein